MAGRAAPVGMNWEKLEAWRKHPLLKFNPRAVFPGFFIGLGAFAVYVAVDKATAKPDAHH